MKTKLWRAANAVMLVLFAFSVIVQYNDPDPVRWMLIYGAAAVVCGFEIRRLTVVPVAMLVALVALFWAASIAPRVIGKVPFPAMFATFEMHDEGVEESREMYGLLIVAAWMLAVAFASDRRVRKELARSK